ncbi:cell division ATP-binding protein FtsE [Candidatus Beckwithbacteria bacterium RBG_13_42_9]|uniref:Cell division ATP-binding protein FtsE n=1 Tax=Candidatus Beckwithbacteria bacterium RBG_13_42_9 TaxID=1797457 RepID=A0A1F5E8M3_9BACT|nr:MAG: cell division ATP-binding protein FtsE [Candidatus Beckwithbacteria bacterium RBG_13_42_9]
MIRFEKVTHQFPNGVMALQEVDFQIEPGEFVFIIGPSGAGKTTLLRLLLRELKPTQGKVWFQNENIAELKGGKIPELRRRIGAVFQDFKLLLDRTILENVSLALQIQNNSEEEIRKSGKEALELVGLADKEEMFPAQLSGGEVQRAVIARAVVGNPDVIFADEPTGNLDPETAWQIVELLRRINQAGKTVIMATHNVDVVDTLKERVIRLEKGKAVGDKKGDIYKKKKHHLETNKE